MGLPTIVGAFSKFSGSATIRVCYKQRRWTQVNLSGKLYGTYRLRPMSEQNHLPLQGQTRRSCDGQWQRSFPRQTRCHIRFPAPSEDPLCNTRRALAQVQNMKFGRQSQISKETTYQYLNWQQPGHCLPHRWKMLWSPHLCFLQSLWRQMKKRSFKKLYTTMKLDFVDLV